MAAAETDDQALRRRHNEITNQVIDLANGLLSEGLTPEFVASALTAGAACFQGYVVSQVVREGVGASELDQAGAYFRFRMLDFLRVSYPDRVRGLDDAALQRLAKTAGLVGADTVAGQTKPKT